VSFHSPTPNDPGDANALHDVLRDQREANEHLIIASLRTLEESDAARGALRDAEDEASSLKATAELRELLIGIIGHDLRTPLTAIVAAGHLLMARGALSAEDTRLASRIVSSGMRMGRLISHLVDFTRARLGGAFDLELARTDLGDVCRTIADELSVGASLEVIVTSEGDLTGTWDADRLGEVVSNVAGNAAEHAAPGTPVTIHARAEGDAVVAEITNQGVCIAPELLPDIFKPFRRAESTANRSAGHLGLGLYIAHEITRAHGGTLAVRSSNGRTTFSLRLPRAARPTA
jgi:signal transduction histidine kinase